MKWSFLPPIDGDDPADDPEEILRQMARDPATPATARLAACRELLRLKKKKTADASSEGGQPDELERRAIAILSGKAARLN